MLKISIYWGLTTVPGFHYHILLVFSFDVWLHWGRSVTQALHVIYVTWAGVILHEPEGIAGKCVHIRQITTAHVTCYVTLPGL